MIPECREVGVVNGRPCGDAVYFLTRYLLRPAGVSFDLIEVEPDPAKVGLMRPVASERVLADHHDVAVHPDRVRLHDRALLLRLARASGRRCTVFNGLDEHVTFVLDPEAEPVLTVHVYDIEPRRPNLSAGICEMEALGLFGDLGIGFCHHVRDIRVAGAEIYPCRAAGFPRTLDADPVGAGASVACCTTGRELIEECHGVRFVQADTCPLGQVDAEPFAARCCRSERRGLRKVNGLFGTVVHWGDSPAQVFDAVREMVAAWRARDADCRR